MIIRIFSENYMFFRWRACLRAQIGWVALCYSCFRSWPDKTFECLVHSKRFLCSFRMKPLTTIHSFPFSFAAIVSQIGGCGRLPIVVFHFPSPRMEAKLRMRASTNRSFSFSFAAGGSQIADAGVYQSQFSIFLRRDWKPDLHSIFRTFFVRLTLSGMRGLRKSIWKNESGWNPAALWPTLCNEKAGSAWRGCLLLIPQWLAICFYKSCTASCPLVSVVFFFLPDTDEIDLPDLFRSVTDNIPHIIVVFTHT